MESPSKLYVPRFYGLEKLGQPHTESLFPGDTIDVPFKGNLGLNKFQLKIYISDLQTKLVED